MFSSITSNSCLLCKQNSQNLLCSVCRQDLQLYDLPACQHDLRNRPEVSRYVAKTLGKEHFLRLLALSEYRWPLAGLVKALKFSRKTVNSKALAELAVEQIQYATLPQAIIPVPLHWQRWFSREYNQVEEIAKHIAHITGIKIRTNILKRVKATQAQTALGLGARKRNLRHAFVAQEAELASLDRVALLDDVITTGATMQAALTTLQQTKPSIQVELWAMCITPEG